MFTVIFQILFTASVLVGCLFWMRASYRRETLRARRRVRRSIPFAAVALLPFTAEAAPSLEWHVYADGYYSHNFNRPAALTVPNASSVSSAAIPDGKNTYRYYDANHNQFSLSLLELSLLAKQGEVSLLADLDFGPFVDMNAASSSASGKAVDEVSKHIGQAVIAYRPEGSRFFLEAGKMYSHIGAETVKAKDNWNYSRTLLFSYGMPFWHTGLRLGYDLVPGQWQASLYAYNGWNSIYDNNHSKSIGAQLKYTPSQALAIAYNFLGGPERPENESEWKTVHELNALFTASESLSVMADLLTGSEKGVTINSRKADAKWYGGLLGVKYSLDDRSYLSPRFEIYRDQHGYTLGSGPQTIKSGTLTYGRNLTPGLDFRAEGRWDSSSRNPFTKGLTSKDSQTTLLAALLFTY